MTLFRHLPGYVLALVLAGVAFAYMTVAWVGWMDRFGWPVAVLAIVLSWVGSFNAYALVGAFFFAFDYLHWDLVQCFALSAVGMMFATRGILADILDFLTGRPVEPR